MPPSKASLIEKTENPKSTIFAEEAMLLMIRIATKNAAMISKYLNDSREEVLIKTPCFVLAGYPGYCHLLKLPIASGDKEVAVTMLQLEFCRRQNSNR